MRLLACLIVAPQQGYDEPGILSYAIRPFCPTSADGLQGTDDFFGEGCLAGQMQRISTVRAMTDSVIVRLEKSAVVRALHEEPAFSEMFIAHLLGRTIRVEADLVDQLFNSSEKRLARMLLLLANFGKESKPEPIIAKISQETLAEMIGTTRSRVSFFMNKFR
jgi:CRP/FNR family transcriptional regulator, cyclic AMP receptor protein